MSRSLVTSLSAYRAGEGGITAWRRKGFTEFEFFGKWQDYVSLLYEIDDILGRRFSRKAKIASDTKGDIDEMVIALEAAGFKMI